MSLHNVLNQHNYLTLVSYFNSDPLRALFKWKCICICFSIIYNNGCFSAWEQQKLPISGIWYSN